MRELIEEINRSGSNIKNVVKKLAIMQGFLYNTARKGAKEEFIIARIEEQLEKILEELNQFGQPVKKR